MIVYEPYVPSVCGQVEGDTQTLLPRPQVGLVELVTLLNCAIARVLMGGGGGGGGREGGRDGGQ